MMGSVKCDSKDMGSVVMLRAGLRYAILWFLVTRSLKNGFVAYHRPLAGCASDQPPCPLQQLIVEADKRRVGSKNTFLSW